MHIVVSGTLLTWFIWRIRGWSALSMPLIRFIMYLYGNQQRRQSGKSLATVGAALIDDVGSVFVG